MGVYLNPGKTAFEEAVHSEIYIDKTELIQYLNTLVKTKQKYVSVSRPRRFGKTMAADMICAYYDREADSYELFRTKKIAECPPAATGADTIHWDSYLGQFDVLRLVMTDFLEDAENVQDFLTNLTEEVVAELKEAYPEVNYGNASRIRTVMSKIYACTKRQFVIVIDEWDALFRVWQSDREAQEKYLDFLRDWLKDKNYIALAYMTGILPIKKYGEHSALNMFDEYSMVQPMQLAEYTGFTEAEVKELCTLYEMDYQEISKWYDGYRLSDAIPVGRRKQFRMGTYREHKRAIYSPLSVVKAMRNGLVDNYWNKTENYEALAEFIRRDYDGLKETVALLMDGGRVRVDLKSYQNDMTTFHGKDDILALLIHLGYLGFEGDQSEGRIDSDYGEVFIPNKEILEEFKTSTKTGEWTDTFYAYEQSEKLLKATWAEDAEAVAELVEAAHNRAGNKTYHAESALSYGIQLAYFAAQKYYTTVLEFDSGKGYADIVYIPAPQYSDKPVLLIELKYEKGADTALSQIRRQKYPESLEHYRGNILLVGINYDAALTSKHKDFKRHTCRIERA